MDKVNTQCTSTTNCTTAFIAGEQTQSGLLPLRPPCHSQAAKHQGQAMSFTGHLLVTGYLHLRTDVVCLSPPFLLPLLVGVLP
eukprot:1139894-Pelagomonas_calceolata.AAC.6